MPGRKKDREPLGFTTPEEEQPEDIRRDIADDDTAIIESGVGSESDLESPIVTLPADEDLPDEDAEQRPMTIKEAFQGIADELPDDLKAKVADQLGRTLFNKPKVGEATDEPRIKVETLTSEEFAVLSGHIPIEIATASEVRFKSHIDAQALLDGIRQVGNFAIQVGSLDDGGTVSMQTYPREFVEEMLLDPLLCDKEHTWLLAAIYGIDIEEKKYLDFRRAINDRYRVAVATHTLPPGELKLGVFHQIDVKVRRLTDTARLPHFAHDTDTGADLFADEDATILGHNHRAMIRTGIALAMPEGFAAFVHDKSGISTSSGVIKIAGVIDNDYRGELIVALINTGEKPYEVRKGQKIAQIVFAPVYKANFEEVDSLDDTERGAGGFGSTGL